MNVFISYRHVQPDRRFLERLRIHLTSIEDDATVWADTGILPGDEWRTEIDEAIRKSDVAILLVSADSLASPFIRDKELPELVKAHRERRLRLVPLFVAPFGVLPDEIAALQGANSPEKPLSSMSRAAQEATLADFVKWLKTHHASPGSRSADDDDSWPRATVLERVPAAGLLFDRQEIQHSISAFLADQDQRLCVINGFPGIGKTTLAASLVKAHARDFAAVFWMTCKPQGNSGVDLVEDLATFLESQGHRWVRTAVEQLPQLGEKGRERLLSRMADALTSAGYLIVLDDFHILLGPASQLIEGPVATLLWLLTRAPGRSKVLLLSDRRVSWEGTFDRYPTGVMLEREVLGLPERAVGELIAEFGLDPGAGAAEAVASYFAGNPGLIKVYCSYVARRHGDPVDALSSASSDSAVGQLIGQVLSDLDLWARRALERLSVLRLPLNWDDLDKFGLEVDHIVPLLDTWVVVLDPASHTLLMPVVVRDYVSAMTPAPITRAAHSWAADGYRELFAKAPRTYDELRPLLEYGYHTAAAGDPDAGVPQVLSAAELLIDWGYADQAAAELSPILVRLKDTSNVARCEVQLGRAYDHRGLLDDAQRHFESAIRHSELARDDRTLAEALFRRGRILNARQNFAAAEHDLLRCIDLCRRLDLGRPEPQARLALAWGRKERGAPDPQVVGDFEEALELADRLQDWSTISGAHRELGFFSWVRLRDRLSAEAHYSTALQTAEDHSLLKEISAVHKDLTYLASEWGDSPAAEGHLRASREADGLLQDAYMSPGVKTNQALVLEKNGDLNGARSLLKESAETFSEQQNPGGEAYALHELARLENQLGAVDHAVQHLDRARQLSIQYGLTLQLRAIEATAKKIGTP